MECKDGIPENSFNYSELYKYNGIKDNQLDRRNKLLCDLKKRRNDQIDKLRGVCDIFDDDDNVNMEEPIDASKYRLKKRNNYAHRIMLSEWMTEIPVDLEEEWLFKICPVGVRNIVVANNGVTRAYNRRNKLKAVFQSSLPGGNHNSKNVSFTLLDCIYRNSEKTYYVLDILVWNSCSLLKCSSDFRFFFLKSKLFEDPDLVCSSNKFNFINIDYYSAALQTMESTFVNPFIVCDQELPIDGILFYHKNCTYMSGLTPLVGWLKPYMLPEKLKIPVHTTFMMKKPQDYISLEQYLKSIHIKYKNKSSSSIGEDTDEMEAESIETSSDMDT